MLCRGAGGGGDGVAGGAEFAGWSPGGERRELRVAVVAAKMPRKVTVSSPMPMPIFHSEKVRARGREGTFAVEEGAPGRPSVHLPPPV